MRSSARRSYALAASLLAAAACDASSRGGESPDAITPAGAPALDLAAKPHLIFQVFGDSANARLMPLAAVLDSALRPIGLTSAGWRALDSLYFAPGTRYPIYNDDVEYGEVVISRGMWNTGEDALYPLPGCRALKPMAAVQLVFKAPRADPTVAFIASSVPLARHATYRGTLPTDEELATLGHEFGHAVAVSAGLDTVTLDSLDFHARTIVTGVSKEPTLLVSFLDPNAGDLGPGTGHTEHLFVLGDLTGAAYAPTYRHAVSGEARTVEFRRLVDHLDVNGDGVDELLLDAWRYGADNDLVALRFAAGQWHEALRIRMSWCLDPPRPKR